MKQLILLSLLILGLAGCSEDKIVCELDYPMDNNIMYRRADDLSPVPKCIHFFKSNFGYSAVGISFSCRYTYVHPIITLHYMGRDGKQIDWPITVGENTLTMKDQEGNTVVYVASPPIQPE